YKSSKVHLKRLPTRGKLVVQGPGENAGVVDIGDGLVAAFKIESHNHPSYIEPFQGATTGVGGILRDIFTMGARPIAVLDSLPSSAAQSRQEFLPSRPSPSPPPPRDIPNPRLLRVRNRGAIRPLAINLENQQPSPQTAESWMASSAASAATAIASAFPPSAA